MSLNLLGCVRYKDVVGFDMADFGSVLATTGDVAKTAISIKEKSDATNKSAADEQKTLSAAIAADSSSSLALAKAAVSAQLKSDSAGVDKLAADQAVQAQARAAGKLSAAGAEKRTEAAEKGLNAALAKAQASPKDAFLQALVKAWTATVTKAHSGKLTSDEEESEAPKGSGKGKALAKTDSEHGGLFLTRKAIGPVPVWGVAAGGVGLAGGLAMILKKVLARRAAG